MKKGLVISSLLSLYFSFAQFGPFSVQDNQKSQDPNLPLITRKFNAIVANEASYWQNIDKFAKGSGYKPYMRFKYFWEDYARTGINPEVSWWNAYLEEQHRRPATDNSQWSLVGETAYTYTSGLEGKGRVNAIAVDPNNPDIIYVGAPAGGLWKTTDGGQTWTPLTDNMPFAGVSAIAIDPQNSDVIYIGTGDDDALNTPSMGIFKSTDGGITWQASGNSANTVMNYVADIIVNPANPNIIIAATSDGVIRTIDGGTTWVNVLSFSSRSIRMHPGNPNIVYAITHTRFWRSTDGGATWTQITNGLPSEYSVDRMVMDVTPAAPGNVYVYANNGTDFIGFYVSHDSGQSFSRTAENDDLTESQQAWYDLEIGVSDTDPNLIIKGELNLMRSTDGGNNFTLINNWSRQNNAYTHADIHFVKYFNGVLYVGTDGGIYRSTDNGNNFENLNDGLAISQVYRISIRPGQNNTKVVGGLQDNGGMAKIDRHWNLFHIADGMDNVIDLYNPSIAYSMIYFGLAVAKTINGGYSSTWISGLPEYGLWVTPMTISPANEIYSAGYAVYKLQNDNWQQVTSNSFNDKVQILKFIPDSSMVVYAGVGNDLYKSTDGGMNFQLVHHFLDYIKGITMNRDGSELWVALFNNVFYSNDGSTWTDISSGLPSGVKINDIEYHFFSSPAVLYAATDMGVYRKTGSNDWERFSTGLPSTIVTDLELDYNSDYLYASTYGRSVWRTPVDHHSPGWDLTILSTELNADLHCNPVSEITFSIKNNGSQTVNQFDYSCQVNGQNTASTWNGNLAANDTVSLTVSLPDTLVLGAFRLQLEINEAHDQVNENNITNATLLINKTESLPFSYDFEQTGHDMLAYAGTVTASTWERAVPSGQILNTATSGTHAYCTNPSGDYNNGTMDYLYLPCLDFSRAQNTQIQFDLAFDIENEWDALYMEYSTDGHIWEVLGTANDSNWYNNSATRGACVGAQWTGSQSVMQTYSHSLNFLNGEPQVYLRFVMASDAYVTGEGAVIDNLEISGILSTGKIVKNASIQLFPNPAPELLHITANEPIFGISIFTATGQQIAGFPVSGEKHVELNVSHLPEGIYHIRIHTRDNYYNKPFIKN